MMKKLFRKFSEKIWKNYDKGLFLSMFLDISTVKKFVKILVYKRIKPEVYYQQQTSGFLYI